MYTKERDNPRIIIEYYVDYKCECVYNNELPFMTIRSQLIKLYRYGT